MCSSDLRLSRTPERAAADPARSSDEWAEAHAAFHMALAGGCDSPWLLRLRGQLYDQSERYRRLSVPLTTQTRNIGEEHQAIVDATLARDPDKAVALLSAHLSATTRILLTAQIDGEVERQREMAE